MKPKILIVEDNLDICSLLFDVLSSDYVVVEANNGVSALLEFKSQKPDLIILDLMLPQLNGHSVLRTVRKTSSVPIIVLTAIQDKASTVKLLEDGANDYLTKPFDIDELQARIKVQLRNIASNEKSPSIITYENIKIDDINHKTYVNNKEILLPKKEFQILKLLISHPHQVFEKEQLFQLIWDEEYLSSSENTLRVHISNLRHKLNELSNHEYIISIWGIGIRFE